jgi:hypothetical protein
VINALQDKTNTDLRRLQAYLVPRVPSLDVVALEGARLREKTLSRAVAQVKGFEIGVVAINIDDVIPADNILKVQTGAQMERMLQAPCEEFLTRHDRHFRKYLSQERLVAAVVSIHCIAEEWEPRFNNSHQSIVWTFPDISPEKAAQQDWHIKRKEPELRR